MFKNLKSLFILEAEGAQKTGEKQDSKETGKSEKSTGPEMPQSDVGKPGKVTEKFIEILFKAMEKNNIDGFDYLEYKQSLSSLKKMPMDEPTRYQSAFAMAQTMGANPPGLIETAEHYMAILKQEEQKFEKALTHQKKEQIGSKQKEIKTLEEDIKAKAAQIKKLTGEIQQQQEEIKTLRQQIDSSTVKIESTKNDFIASYNTLVNQIRKDIENIEKYLK